MHAEDRFSKQTPVQRWAYVIATGVFAGLLLALGVPAAVYHTSLLFAQNEDQIPGYMFTPAFSGEATTLQAQGKQVSRRLAPSLVRIVAVTGESPNLWEGNDESSEVTDYGVGAVIDHEGYILTNHRLVSQAQKITVTLWPGNVTREATVAGMDEETDLALLKINPIGVGLASLPLGNPRAVSLGSAVYAVGPHSESGTFIAVGSLSGLGDDCRPQCLNVEGFIHANLNIPPYLRGGVLTDIHGRVIGLLSAVPCPSGSKDCLAIPAHQAVETAKLLRDHGRVPRAWLGVLAHDLLIDEAIDHDLTTVAVQIDYVFPNSPAEHAGLLEGDVILTADNQSVECAAELRRLILKAHPGSPLQLDIFRNRQPLRIMAQIGRQRLPMTVLPGEEELGIRVKYLTRSQAATLGVSSNEGVVIVATDRSQSVRPGQIIVAVDGTPTPDLASFCRLANHWNQSSRCLLSIRQYVGGKEQTSEVEVVLNKSRKH